MKKLTLSLLLSGALLSSQLASAKMIDGYQALSQGEGEQAYALFLKEAPKNPQAAFVLGMMNYEGVGVAENLEEAQKWLHLAADAGSVEALYNLAILYLEEEFFETQISDVNPGLELLLKASEQQYENAIVRLGIELIENKGEPRSFFTENVITEMLEKLTQALEVGNGFAGFILGAYWAEAERFGLAETDYLKAVSFLEKSFKAGFLPASMGLAALYEEGGYGLLPDEKKAAKYQKIVFESMSMIGSFEELLPGIASIYSVMTPAEQKQMLGQLEKEAKNNSIPAIMKLIERYDLGIGIERNASKVSEYLQQLEKINSGESLFALGDIFSKKNEESMAHHYMQLAVEQDYLPAILWMSNPQNHPWNVENEVIAKYELKGANLGNPLSIHAVIQRLEQERDHSGWWSDEARPAALINQEIYQWADKLLQFAPEESETYLLLSMIYEKGMGTETDPIKSFEYLEKAYEYAPENERVLLRLAQMYHQGYGTAQNFELAANYYLTLMAKERNVSAIEGLLGLNKATVGFQGNRALQSKILGIELDDYANQNQYVPIMDQLLDELEAYIEESEQETIYGYLIADRYFSQYIDLYSVLKREPERATELTKKLNEARKQANVFFKNAYHHSEQAKLHYAQALLILQNHEENEIQAQKFADESRRALSDIDSLVNPLADLPQSDLYLTEREQLSAIETMFELLELEDSLEFQSWFGEGVLRNLPSASKALTKFVEEKGDAAAPFAIYYLGREEVRNGQMSGYDRIVTAANKNYLPAIHYLGKNYYEGKAEIIDYLGGSKLESLKWYEKGSALGDDQSTYELAEIYAENEIGISLPAGENDLRAIHYYEQLKEPSYRFAKSHLRDAKERVENYRKIQQGLQKQDPEAYYQQSEVYRYGRYGARKDLVKADEYLIKAADLGYLPAMRQFYDRYHDDQTITGETLERFNRYHIGYVLGSKRDWETQRLADRYLKGDRIPESRQKAREYYEFALQNDSDSSASYDLGYMNHFDQNLPLAERGNAEAMLVIGRAYDNGNGVKKDVEKAYYWLEKSANAGNSDAAFYFGVSAQEGVISEQGEVIIAPNWELALQWYEKASSRFRNAISGRVKEYETIYQPAQKGDLTAMMALADLYSDRYRSRHNPYDLEMAKEWYKKAINADGLHAHFGLMKLLPESEQSDYLQSLLDNAGDATFKIQLSELLVKQDASVLTQEQLQLAVDHLTVVAKDQNNDSKIRTQAMKQLLQLYHRDYRLQDNSIVSAPDFEKSQQLVLAESEALPLLKRFVADALYEQKDFEGAKKLWQEAADTGDYVAILRLYSDLLPGYYDTVTLQALTKLEALYEQYLSVVPDYPIGPKAYSLFLEAHSDFEGILDNEARAEISRTLAQKWQKNGHDFMADLERSKKWYQHALNLYITKDSINNLIQLTKTQYAQNPDNLQYLAELYLYGRINDEIHPEDYPFERLSKLQKFVLDKQVTAYQDERDYGRNKWVMIEHQAESDAGNGRSSYLLAENYHYGRYARQNIEKAIEYYELAGSRGEAAAYNRLGNMFRKNEEGVEPDYPRALAYFEKGAALGDSNTAHLAGDMLYFGEGGLEKDYAKAAEYYTMTDLVQGNHHALAKFKQAEIIYQGLISPPTAEDYQKVFELLSLAAEHGEKRAVKALSTWVFMDMNAVENDQHQLEEAEEIEKSK